MFGILRLPAAIAPAAVATIAAILPLRGEIPPLFSLFATVIGAFGALFILAVAVVRGRCLFSILVLIAAVVALAPLLLEAGAVFTENAIIMIGELKIIFALHAIAGELRVARHVLVFFQQLGGVPALPIVLAIARLPQILGPLAPTAAPAAALTIIDQMPTSSKQ